LVEELVPTEEDMENEVLVQAVNHFKVGFRDGAYPLLTCKLILLNIKN